MKAAFVSACLLGFIVSACAGGSPGNPGGKAYAGMPGGVIAVQPQTLGIVVYDPNLMRTVPDLAGLPVVARDENLIAPSENR